MEAIEQLNQFGKLLSFQRTWLFHQFINMPFDKIALFTGNQFGKSAACVVNYIYRIMGWHSIPKKNFMYFECPKLIEEIKAADKVQDESLIKHPYVKRKLVDGSEINIHREGEYSDTVFYPSIFPARYSKSVKPVDNKCTFCGEHLQIHKRESKIYRFASEVLPGEKENIGGEEVQSTEIKNAIYPEIKKWLPPFLISKDITVRRPAMTIRDPNTGGKFGDIEYSGGEIVFEFVAYHQTVQSGAGVQRVSVMADEEPPYSFYEEQMPRLVAEDGDFLVALTPANRISYMYDEIFGKADLYIRTQTICKFLKTQGEKDTERIKHTNNNNGIVVLQAATDDNPTLSRSAIEKKYIYDDPDTLATRRYGVFRQTTGKIFNDFNYGIHVIDMMNYFSNGIIPE
jgi:hypothetical protein